MASRYLHCSRLKFTSGLNEKKHEMDLSIHPTSFVLNLHYSLVHGENRYIRVLFFFFFLFLFFLFFFFSYFFLFFLFFFFLLSYFFLFFLIFSYFFLFFLIFSY